MKAILLAVGFAEAAFLVPLVVSGDPHVALRLVRRFIDSIDIGVISLFFAIATVALVVLTGAAKEALDEPEDSEDAERRVQRLVAAALTAIALTMVMETTFIIALWQSQPAALAVSGMGACVLIFYALEGAGIALRRDRRVQRRRALRLARAHRKLILRRRLRLFRGVAPTRALLLSSTVIVAWWAAVTTAGLLVVGLRDPFMIAVWYVIVVGVGALIAAAPVAALVLGQRRLAAGMGIDAASPTWLRSGATAIALLLVTLFVWPKSASSLSVNVVVVTLAVLPLSLLPALHSLRGGRARWWTPAGSARQAYAAIMDQRVRSIEKDLAGMRVTFSSDSTPARA